MIHTDVHRRMLYVHAASHLVHLVTGTTHAAKLLQLSTRGATFETLVPFGKGEQLLVVIRPASMPEYRAVAEVTACAPANGTCRLFVEIVNILEVSTSDELAAK